MKIEPIENFLSGMTPCQLNCLSPDRKTYGLMILQPDGPIEGSSERVGFFDRDRGTRLCMSFLRGAVEEAADLVICPEYSVPHEVVKKISDPDEKLSPQEGKIWVLGCESSTREDLEDIVSTLLEKGHFVFHEALRNEGNGLGNYYDPLLYVFWAAEEGEKSRLCFVFQFKTTPSRDVRDVEQTSLCTGETIYTINRKIDQIGLMAINCSDAFHLSDDLLNKFHSNMLLLHIQLNPKPAHVDYSFYRKRLMSIASEKEVELMCINWAGKLVEKDEKGNEKPWTNNSGTAIYCPPRKFKGEEAVIEEAHRGGLYYSLVQKWHGFFLNQEAHAILIQKQKVMMHGEANSTAPTSCVKVLKRWVWDSTGGVFTESPTPGDGFLLATKPYEKVSGALVKTAHKSTLTVERALELLVGSARHPDRWYEVGIMECMRVTDAEAMRRVTVHQDNDLASEGTAFRRTRLQRAQDSKALVGAKIVPWPAPIKELEKGFEFSWSREKPYENVSASESGKGACLIYLADQADEEEVKTIHRNAVACERIHIIKASLEAGVDCDDDLKKCGDRVCVVYRRDHRICVWGVGKISNIDRNPDQGDYDIAREA